MIEQLFARQGQEQAFLAMVLSGLVLGVAAQVCAWARRRWRRTAVVLDVCLALLLLAALMTPLMLLDTPLRLYALLGLTLGAALWAAGIAPIVSAAVRKSARLRRKSGEQGRI